MAFSKSRVASSAKIFVSFAASTITLIFSVSNNPCHAEKNTQYHTVVAQFLHANDILPVACGQPQYASLQDLQPMCETKSASSTFTMKYSH
jgi:uncharacterized membrane protein YfbV (UPF0208 family)